MALIDGINFIQYSENMIGGNHPLALTDTLNRALKEFIEKFELGDADTQVTRNHIKIDSATDIQAGVVSDEVVWFNPSTSKWEKAIDENATGIIDVENLMVFIFGMYTFKTLNSLVIGTKYYLDETTPGGITDTETSQILIGTAFDTNTILNVTTGGAGGAGGMPSVEPGAEFNEIANDGVEGIWSPIRLNPIEMNINFTVPAGANGQVAGPFTIGDGYELTISDGSVLVIN